MPARLLILIVGFLLIPGAQCLAQLIHATENRANSIGTYAGDNDDRAASAVWIAGTTQARVSNNRRWPDDRGLMLVGIEHRFTLFEGELGSIKTAPALLPVVYTTGNMRTEVQDCGVLEVCEVGVPYSSFGIGLIPLSIRMESSPLGRLRLVGYLNGGGVWSTQRIPAEWGTHFNFLAQLGADFDFSVGHGVNIEPGIRHLHLSNGGTAKMNPGLDTSLLVLGISWR